MDRRLPSVTQIISPWQDWSNVPPDRLEPAADRGSRAHDLFAAHCQGLWVPEVPEEPKVPEVPKVTKGEVRDDEITDRVDGAGVESADGGARGSGRGVCIVMPSAWRSAWRRWGDPSIRVC